MTDPRRDADGLLAEVEALWQRSKPTAHERIDAVRSALDAATAGTLDDDTRADAAMAAHKLGGSLGMFGLVDSAELAIELDRLVASGGLDDTEGRRHLARCVDELTAALEDDR